MTFQKRPIDYDHMSESRIVPLLMLMNKLPWLHTTQSCEGHIDVIVHYDGHGGHHQSAHDSHTIDDHHDTYADPHRSHDDGHGHTDSGHSHLEDSLLHDDSHSGHDTHYPQLSLDRPNEGLVSLSPGYIDFQLDSISAVANNFRQELEQYAEERPFLYFGVNPFKRGPEEYSLLTVVHDLITNDAGTITSDAHYHPRGYFKMDYPSALRRFTQWNMVILDLHQVIESLVRHKYSD